MNASRSWLVVGHIVCLLFSLAVLVPMLFVFGVSLKPDNEVFSTNPITLSPTLSSYAAILSDENYLRFFWNSIATTSLRVSGQLLLCIFAAYAFARFEFLGRDLIFMIMLAAMMIPPQLTVIPNYILIADLGWFDTYQGLIIPNLAMPFGVFLLRQHLLSFPRELYDAAEIDGAGHWRALWLIVVPNLGPASAALTIVLFIDCWNEYFWPLIVTDSPASQTLQIGLRALIQEEVGTSYNLLMAAVTLASLPALLIFFILQRKVMESFASSGIKG